MKKTLLFLCTASALIACNNEQPAATGVVSFNRDDIRQQIDVLVDGKLFTRYIYPDTLKKQALYPLLTATGNEVSRGYPIAPRPFERVSHGHHTGMWFNYGNVNGVNFWNNSFQVKPEDKPRHGTIKFKEVLAEEPQNGLLKVASEWVDFHQNPLLAEETTFIFSGDDSTRTIDRTSVLTALTEVTFTESIEGMLGMRMDRVFEEPTLAPIRTTDAYGNVTDSLFLNNEGLNGKYRNANGLEGADVWGKRSPWVALRGVKDGELITVAVIDHQRNFGYPAWSHARGYGMFSTNNFGGRAYDPEAEEIKLDLSVGESVTLRHKIIFRNGELTDDELNALAAEYK